MMNEQEKKARFLMALAMDLRLTRWHRLARQGKAMTVLINGRYS